MVTSDLFLFALFAVGIGCFVLGARYASKRLVKMTRERLAAKEPPAEIPCGTEIAFTVAMRADGCLSLKIPNPGNVDDQALALIELVAGRLGKMEHATLKGKDGTVLSEVKG